MSPERSALPLVTNESGDVPRPPDRPPVTHSQVPQPIQATSPELGDLASFMDVPRPQPLNGFEAERRLLDRLDKATPGGTYRDFKFQDEVIRLRESLAKQAVQVINEAARVIPGAKVEGNLDYLPGKDGGHPRFPDCVAGLSVVFPEGSSKRSPGEQRWEISLNLDERAFQKRDGTLDYSLAAWNKQDQVYRVASRIVHPDSSALESGLNAYQMLESLPQQLDKVLAGRDREEYL